MIPIPIRILAIASSVMYLWSVLAALRGSHMTVRQSILWIVSGMTFFSASVFPYPLMWLAEQCGFVAPSNAAFAVWLLVVTVLVFYQSLTTSRQAAQLKTLCQELAILGASLEKGKKE